MILSRSMQIIICALPYVLTLFLLTIYVQPAWDMSSRSQNELQTLTVEFNRLEQKVREKEALIRQKNELDRDIQRMRAAVPTKPDMDILLIDMERLSSESGTDLIAIEPATDDKKGKGENLMDSIIAEVGGKLTPPANKPNTPTKPQQPAVKKQEEPADQNILGIKHIERRVYVSGSYAELMSFLKRLEAYQRIVGIRNLNVAMPESNERETLKTMASEKGRNLELNQPVMTFLMSIYYLP
jgi:Tfp pilus assembly protein PilO